MKVKLITAKTFEIDPTKKYILVIDKKELTKDEANKINQELEKWGAKSLSVLLDNIDNAKVIEL